MGTVPKAHLVSDGFTAIAAEQFRQPLAVRRGGRPTQAYKPVPVNCFLAQGRRGLTTGRRLVMYPPCLGYLQNAILLADRIRKKHGY